MINKSLVLILFVSSLATQTLGQDDTRGTNDKVQGEGQARSIYSQRHLSPHRMMHFGRRSEGQEAPSILMPRVIDPYPQQRRLQPDKYPYLLSFELERGRTLQPVSEADLYEDLKPGQNFMYSLERPFQQQQPLAAQQQPQLLQQIAKQQMNGQRYLKLLANEGNDINEDGERAQPSANSSDDDQQQELAIGVSARSMQTTRSNTLNLPKAYISSLLYNNRQPLPHFSSFNKKAEPKSNLFMHFGRK